MKNLKNFISISYTFLKFSIIKFFHWNSFKFNFVERFSPDTCINIWRGASFLIGKRVRAHTGSKFSVVTNGELIIGNNASFSYGCMVMCRKKIVIGEGVELGPNVLIYDHDHDFRVVGGIKAKKYKCGSVEIGNNVWIGANTVILRNTKIGENCIIGAGSVIKGEYLPNSVVVQKRETSLIKF